MSVGIVLAHSLWFIPTILLAVVLIKAAKNGYKGFGLNIRQSNEMKVCSIDSDCPPEHICIQGLCIPESKLKELISSMV
ncbi:MAG: hypothetical protein JSU58_11320 [Dehalococcoidales bacterium]|nr:MAG: hypothetical protein JSU58_11320 [Dehalococcoidales bacterium]